MRAGEARVRLCWRESRHILDRGTLPVPADLKQLGTRRDGPQATGRAHVGTEVETTPISKAEGKKEQRKQVGQQNEW